VFVFTERPRYNRDDLQLLTRLTVARIAYDAAELELSQGTPR